MNLNMKNTSHNTVLIVPKNSCPLPHPTDPTQSARNRRETAKQRYSGWGTKQVKNDKMRTKQVSNGQLDVEGALLICLCYHDGKERVFRACK